MRLAFKSKTLNLKVYKWDNKDYGYFKYQSSFSIYIGKYELVFNR